MRTVRCWSHRVGGLSDDRLQVPEVRLLAFISGLRLTNQPPRLVGFDRRGRVVCDTGTAPVGGSAK